MGVGADETTGNWQLIDLLEDLQIEANGLELDALIQNYKVDDERIGEVPGHHHHHYHHHHHCHHHHHHHHHHHQHHHHHHYHLSCFSRRVGRQG
jgi:hypothetical protein